MSNGDGAVSAHGGTLSLLANGSRASSGRRGKVRRADNDGRIVFILTVALVAMSFYFGKSSPAAILGGCRVFPNSLAFESVNDVAMTVKRGSACGVWARIATAFVDSMNVEVSPQHGSLQRRGLTGVIYTPDRGYVGKDFFALARHGASAAYKGTSLTRIEVTVE
jgi:hypothetical protein